MKIHIYASSVNEVRRAIVAKFSGLPTANTVLMEVQITRKAYQLAQAGKEVALPEKEEN